MLPSFLLALREGFEIALILGIVYGALHQFKRRDLVPTVQLGAGIALLISLIGGIVLTAMGAAFEGRAEEIFEGVMMWTAAGVLTWMILWMQSRAHLIKKVLTEEVGSAARVGKTALFVLAFVAVLREGIELALFLTASVFATGASQTVLGALGGLLVAALLGWGLYRASIKLNMRRFFQVTSILLVLFAAGLVAHGMHEFNEAGLIPGIVEHLWDTNSVLDENSLVGQVLKTLFGYNGNPSLSEVLAYLTYFVVLFAATRPRKAALAPAAIEQQVTG
jgi:high-affinity iron transporter